MDEPGQLPSPDPHGRVGHETTDASPFYIGLFALGLALMIALVLPLMGWIFWQFEAAARRADPIPNPLAGDQVPPAPRLQAEPAAELASLRREEYQRLSSYGWIDPQQRVVRVPVERAIEILAERGLPELRGSLEPAKPKEPAP
jgi:hypothetical protein